jgi:hypothetical protein
MLGGIVHAQINARLDTIGPHVHAVFYSFSANEIVGCTYAFVSFLLDESLQSRALSYVGREQFLRDNVNPDKLREVGSLLSHFIFSWRVLPIETTILALMDRDDDPNVFPILEYLLLESPHLSQRIDSFYSLNMDNHFWKDPFVFQKISDYNNRFPDGIPMLNSVIMPRPAILPIYYGNTAIRILPILDVLIGRLIENDKKVFLGRLFDRYQKLYVYHDAPISNVGDLLFYYYESPLFFLPEHYEFKLKLLSLLGRVCL